MDLKEAYQIEAETLAIDYYGKEYDELSETIQYIIYNKAIEIVNDGLQEEADILAEELYQGKNIK